VSNPGIQFSVGTGDAFFICPGPPPPVPTGQLFGEATATQLRGKMGGTILAACARPPGTGKRCLPALWLWCARFTENRGKFSWGSSSVVG